MGLILLLAHFIMTTPGGFYPQSELDAVIEKPQTQAPLEIHETYTPLVWQK